MAGPSGEAAHKASGVAEMQQGSSRPSAGRLANVPRKLWRSRAKSQSRVSALSVCTWSPEGSCRWRCRTGGRLTLRTTSLVALTEAEAAGLRPLAISRLQGMGLGCKVDTPREDSSDTSAKVRRRPALLRKKAITTSFFESRKESDIPSGQVFGVPLQQVLQSDQQRFPDATLADPDWATPDWGSDAAAAVADSLSRRSDDASESSVSSLVDLASSDLRKDSVDSLRHRGSATDAGDEEGIALRGPQVPRVVNCCLRYLEDFGLNTVGIFRVSSSKRRVRQLREEFDSGREVQLDQERQQPHDVAQLLKEYLRDLPQPLLTRDLYVPFLYTQRVHDRNKQLELLRQLVRLLPTYSRDTLWALLRFLRKVADTAVDRQSPAGQLLPGNKMDAHNLATMLGPNILRLSKTEKDKFIVENLERAEERCDVILVVRQLIENYEHVFRVPAEDLDSLYRRLLIERPEDLEILLRRHYYNSPGSQDDDDSNDQVFDDDGNTEDPEADLRTVLMRPPVHRSRERKVEESALPFILITPEARAARALASSTLAKEDDKDVTVSFTMKMPSAPDVPAYLESDDGARSATRPPQKTSAEQQEVTITIEIPPRKSKAPSSSRRFLTSKEKEEKAYKINKSKSTSSILNFFGASSDTRRDSGDGAEEGRQGSAGTTVSATGPRRNSREVRFQTEKWRRCEIISSEHTDKRHK